ncbi:MAG TPA: DUF2520 domain-containing protein, partial [Myxococcota bacterium]|nr:DUF2520 domain-containing protein [Myxococcota bacterium]
LHPVLPCPTPERAAATLPGATFALEGEPAALPVLEALVAQLGGHAFRLDAPQKARYHAALVMASNLVLALLDAAAAELGAAGAGDATPALLGLAAQAVAEAQTLGIREGLTGPALRGDATTVARHLGALGPEARPLYAALTRRAVAMAGTRGLSEIDVARLLALLGKPGEGS